MCELSFLLNGNRRFSFKFAEIFRQSVHSFYWIKNSFKVICRITQKGANLRICLGKPSGLSVLCKEIVNILSKDFIGLNIVIFVLFGNMTMVENILFRIKSSDNMKFIYLFIYLFIHLFVYLFIYLIIYLFIYYDVDHMIIFKIGNIKFIYLN